MAGESKASQDVRLRAAAWRLVLMRNNSGAYDPKRPPSPGTRWGWGNESKRVNKVTKSGDLVGWLPLVITPEMVGKQVAVIANIEAKGPQFKILSQYPDGSREQAQDRFNKLIVEAGGIAGFARSAGDLDELINQYFAWLKS